MVVVVTTVQLLLPEADITIIVGMKQSRPPGPRSLITGGANIFHFNLISLSLSLSL